MQVRAEHGQENPKSPRPAPPRRIVTLHPPKPENAMSKGMERKKETKKKPLKTPQEKRDEKREKQGK